MVTKSRLSTSSRYVNSLGAQSLCAINLVSYSYQSCVPLKLVQLLPGETLVEKHSETRSRPIAGIVKAMDNEWPRICD